MKKKLNFGKAIKIIRAEYDLNRKQLAKQAGISYPYLTDMERGVKRPSADMLTKIAEALSMSASELLARIEQISEKIVDVTGGSLYSIEQPTANFSKEVKLKEQRVKNKDALINDTVKELKKLSFDDINLLLKIIKRLRHSTKNE